MNALQKIYGAAGADKWAGYETAHMPLNAVQLLFQTCLRWHHTEQIPTAFAIGRQFNIPKTQNQRRQDRRQEHQANNNP